MKLPIRKFLIAIALFAQISVHAQLLERSKSYPITGIGDANLEVLYRVVVTSERILDLTLFWVFSAIDIKREYGAFLLTDGDGFGFAEGVNLGAGTKAFAGDPGGSPNWSYLIVEYDWSFGRQNVIRVYTPDSQPFPSQTSILIGFKRQHPSGDGMQYGWFRLTRETADLKMAYDPATGREHQTSFLPAGFAVHPIPDQPIRAGMPPELPQLVPEWVSGEPGEGNRVRVRWPAGLKGVHLERADSLEAPVLWTYAAGAEPNEATFELPEDGQLFLRLAYGP
jgi:hypothetical protein